MAKYWPEICIGLQPEASFEKQSRNKISKQRLMFENSCQSPICLENVGGVPIKPTLFFLKKDKLITFEHIFSEHFIWSQISGWGGCHVRCHSSLKRSFLERRTGGCSGRLFISIKGEEICGEESTRTEKDIDMCVYVCIAIYVFLLRGKEQQRDIERERERMSGKEGE